MRIDHVRQHAGNALVQFATERSLERQQMERSVTAADISSAARANVLATLAGARWFEQALLWLGWRIHPQHLTWN